MAQIAYFPFEIYLHIIADDIDVYRGLLSLPCFVRELTPEYKNQIIKNVGVTITCDGEKLEWRLKGILHRVDGPAVVDINGNEHWFYHGKLHRGPDASGKERAAVASDRTFIWYKHGQQHRIDGPAIIYDGRNERHFEGMQRHTEPPQIFDNTDNLWWLQNGQYHREDGPSIITAKIIAYYNRGQYHREDGPSVITAEIIAYHNHGQYHREDGPALINGDGSVYWYINGALHRVDGPAVELASGEIQYWTHGRQLDDGYFDDYTSANPYDQF